MGKIAETNRLEQKVYIFCFFETAFFLLHKLEI